MTAEDSERARINEILAAEKRQRATLRDCSHIVPCDSQAACDAMTHRQITSMQDNRKLWSKSTWGNLAAHMRMSAAWYDMMNALGPLDSAEMAAIREVLGEERFRLLLNAYERLGGFVLEGTEGRLRVLP